MNTIRVAPVELIQSLLSMTFFLRTNGRTDKGDPRRPKNVKKLLPCTNVKRDKWEEKDKGEEEE